jgi:hypothetical protein
MQKIDQLITALGAQTVATTAPTSSLDSGVLVNAFNGMQDMLAKQLDIHSEMNSHARDNKDLMQKLLNVSM